MEINTFTGVEGNISKEVIFALFNGGYTTRSPKASTYKSQGLQPQRTQTETDPRKRYKKWHAHNVARVKPQKDHFQLETTKKKGSYIKNSILKTITITLIPNPKPKPAPPHHQNHQLQAAHPHHPQQQSNLPSLPQTSRA